MDQRPWIPPGAETAKQQRQSRLLKAGHTSARAACPCHGMIASKATKPMTTPVTIQPRMTSHSTYQGSRRPRLPGAAGSPPASSHGSAPMTISHPPDLSRRMLTFQLRISPPASQAIGRSPTQAPNVSVRVRFGLRGCSRRNSSTSLRSPGEESGVRQTRMPEQGPAQRAPTRTAPRSQRPLRVARQAEL